MHFAASVSSVAPFAVARKCRSTRRGAVAVRAAATPFYHKGKPALSGVLSVPKAEEAKFDAMWKSHAKWMSETHLIGPNAAEDDEGHPRMLEYYVSKGDEMKDPMAEDSEPTGNVLYCVNEKYVDPAGLQEHMRLGEETWEKFPELMEAIEKYGVFLNTNGVILTNYADAPPVCSARTGDTCITLSIAVPASMESEVDQIWYEHEEFMRATHKFTTGAGDDLKAPRLTQFTISKGYGVFDPMDPNSSKTGKVVYTMHEAYVHPDGLKGHMGLGEKYPELFNKLMPLIENNAVYMDFGQTTVFVNFTKKQFVSNVITGFTGLLDTIRSNLEKVTGEKENTTKA